DRTSLTRTVVLHARPLTAPASDTRRTSWSTKRPRRGRSHAPNALVRCAAHLHILGQRLGHVEWLYDLINRINLLEPISKSPEQDKEAGELNEPKKICRVILTANEDAALPLYPGEEALDQPAATPH